MSSTVDLEFDIPIMDQNLLQFDIPLMDENLLDPQPTVILIIIEFLKIFIHFLALSIMFTDSKGGITKYP